MLKYLFIAEYKDGSRYEQNVDDISITDNKRSCFFDIRQDDLLRFHLIGADRTFTIDLSDAHFEVNSIPFFLHDQALSLTDIQLVYFRQHTHNFNQALQELSHDIVFQLGFRAINQNGKSIKRTMEIK